MKYKLHPSLHYFLEKRFNIWLTCGKKTKHRMPIHENSSTWNAGFISKCTTKLFTVIAPSMCLQLCILQYKFTCSQHLQKLMHLGPVEFSGCCFCWAWNCRGGNHRVFLICCCNSNNPCSFPFSLNSTDLILS